MIFWLLVITALLSIATFRFRRRRMYKLASLLPAVDDELPFLGIACKLSGNSEDVLQKIKNYSYMAMKHDGIMHAWCGPFLLVAVLNPVDVEYVMKNCLEKSDLHKMTRNVIGNGGIFAPVSIWRRRRKILIPTFSPKIVESFVEVFSRQAEKLANILSSYTDTGPITMWPFLSTYTFDSVCETTMGVKMNAQENPDTPFLVAMNKLLHLVCERSFHPWLQPNWLYRFFPQHKQYVFYLKKMYDFVDEVIRKKKEELKSNNNNKMQADNEYDLGNYQNKTFLDHLIHISGGEKGYTNVELREEVLTLAVAGTDTSAVAVGFTMILLAKYPHIQEKVYREIYEIYGDSDRLLVKEDLMKLKYLDKVVKETMRLFPPVPMTLRKSTEDVSLPSGRIIPAGSTIVIFIWGLHRDPKYWGPTVDEFDPDRFLPERFNPVHPCSFMPFSQGPRNCVGYQYALMSIKAGLSAILRRYRVVGETESSPVPSIRVKLDIMMKAVDGYHLALERRKPVA